MKTIFRAAITTLGAAIFGTILAPAASAGCGYSPRDKPATPSQAKFEFKPAAFLLVDKDGDSEAGIVGLWKVKLVSKNNPGMSGSFFKG